MVRQPAVHLKKQHLISILIDVLGYQKVDAEQMAEAIFVASKRYNIVNRVKVDIKQANIRKVENAKTINNTQLQDFNLVLNKVRLELNHKNIKVILKSDKQYAMLLTVAADAYDYAKEYYTENKIKEGLEDYVKTCLKWMKDKYTLTMFMSYRERIFKYGDFKRQINNDDDKSSTEYFYLKWKDYCDTLTGVPLDYKDPEQYIHFLRGRIEADSLRAEYDDWIEAQFEALHYLGGIPKPNQLYGEKAIDHYRQYLFKHKKNKKTLQQVKDDARMAEIYKNAVLVEDNDLDDI